MAKSNRHKKLRRQEKAKTQLTGVKKLSKAKNVVEPILKVKKILIREQLKSSSNQSSEDVSQEPWKTPSSRDSISGIDIEQEGTSRRKQNLQELLSSANHHNVNIRRDALIGLQEIASTHFNTISRNLDKILGKLANLTSDLEGVVRKENMKLAEIVISKITENQLRPFWSMLIAHLKCTLTHLMPSIRYNAIFFVELLVVHHPQLVAENSSVILQNILSLISSTTQAQSKQSQSLSNPSTATTTKLKVEIAGKQSDVSGRLKVIQLLEKILTVCSDACKTAGSVQTPVEPTEYLPIRYPFGYSWDMIDEKRIAADHMVHGIEGSYSSRFYSTITADPFLSPFDSESTQSASNVWIDIASQLLIKLRKGQ